MASLRRLIRPMSTRDFFLALTKVGCNYTGYPNLAGVAFTNVRLALRPLRTYRRYKMARQVTAASPISRAEGYYSFGGNDFHGVDKLLQTSNEVLAEKGIENLYEWYATHAKGKSKNFFFNILTEDDLIKHPYFLEFALSDDVLKAVIPYYGKVPQLASIGLYVSPPNPEIGDGSKHEGSQNWHIDGTDPHHVKCFINVNDVDEAAGPFTFIPMDKTNELRRKNGGAYRSAGLEDKDLLAEYEAKYAKSLVGKPGTGAFVDTSNCLHYGSRAQAKGRIAFMFHFAVFGNYTDLAKNPLRDIRLHHYPTLRQTFARDRLRSMVLTPG